MGGRTQRQTSDAIAEFFAELGRRGHEPLLRTATGSARFDVADGKRTERWLLTIDKGKLGVSRRNAAADCVMRADRPPSTGRSNGKLNLMAAALRGEFTSAATRGCSCSCSGCSRDLRDAPPALRCREEEAMSDGLVKILDGNTFVVSDARGDIEASPTDPTGLFSYDTRFLSEWVLTINGERMNPLSVDDLQYFETRFFLVPGTGTVYIDAKLSVIRRRAVANGFHEELTILNHDDEPVDLTVRLDAGCDFADLFEVKDALKKKGTYSARVESGKLVLAYDRGTFGRSTAISSSQRARVDEKGLTFKIRIGPHGKWSTQLDVVTERLGIEESAGRRGPGEVPAARMRQGLERWVDQAPRLECDWEPLQDDVPPQPGRPGRAALLAAHRRRPQPAGSGPALVHDHVRPRQHPHQPAGAAVHAPSSPRRRCGRSGTGRGSAWTTSATRIPAGSCTRCGTAR